MKIKPFKVEERMNAYTCNSLSKTFSITGWRLGYVIGSAEVIEEIKKVHDFMTVGAPAPLQEAVVAGLMPGYILYQRISLASKRSGKLAPSV